MLDLGDARPISDIVSRVAPVSEGLQLPIDELASQHVVPFNSQLLKWIGNKQRLAPEIISYFPSGFGTYFEPFLGSGGVLATLAPPRGVASDGFPPLIEIWKMLKDEPQTLKQWYAERWQRMTEAADRKAAYEGIKASYNAQPNGADLVFLCRACYGGVVRFRQSDGYMSTPCGVHKPISPASFAKRVDEWHMRTAGTTFRLLDFQEAMKQTRSGDLVYCDPPYRHSQTILYGAQRFSFVDLLNAIRDCKERGVYVALSIDGVKRSGQHVTELSLPRDLFEREIFIDCGGSMLKRFQMSGASMEDHVVTDRLLLTY
jgi:DNA adenine methylase